MKNVVVLGGSYGGARAASVLAKTLPADYRVVLVDRNSHVNHLYIMPRVGVLPGHEHKAFIPYTRFFSPPSEDESGPSLRQGSPPTRHLFLHASAIKLNAHSVILDRAFPEYGLPTTEIPFEYLVYALGSHPPSPIDLWSSDHGSDDEEGPGHGTFAGERMHRSQTTDVASIRRRAKVKYGGTKREGVVLLKRFQNRIARAENILIVGGGALGVQYATDIATVYPEKQVTLLHSRDRLLPRFTPVMHTEALKGLGDAHVNVILGERLDLSSVNDMKTKDGMTNRVVRTESGREITSDLLLMCTGQLSNTGLLRDMSPRSVDPSTGLIHVLPTMQVGVLPRGIEVDEEKTPYSHIFAIGDAANAFGAMQAGHTAWNQADVAAANIMHLIEFEKEKNATETPKLQLYEPTLPIIKVSLGLGAKSVIEEKGIVRRKDESEPEDLHANLMWQLFGFKNVTQEEMHL